MQKLFDGYARFRSSQWPERRKTFEGLADAGQSPQTMVIACSDSRVDPTMIFDAEPGELFILRNVANLVPPYEPDTAFHATSAALEYAVRVLEVTDLIVMGHAMCGGIRVLLDGPPAQGGDFLVPWMRIAESAKFRVLARAPADERAIKRFAVPKANSIGLYKRDLRRERDDHDVKPKLSHTGFP